MQKVIVQYARWLIKYTLHQRKIRFIHISLSGLAAQLCRRLLVPRKYNDALHRLVKAVYHKYLRILLTFGCQIIAQKAHHVRHPGICCLHRNAGQLMADDEGVILINNFQFTIHLFKL